MNTNFVDYPCQFSQPIQIDAVGGIDRWDVFHRLQALSIACECSQGSPLKVDVKTVATAVQLWSVIQQVTAPRQTIIAHLERCWQGRSD